MKNLKTAYSLILLLIFSLVLSSCCNTTPNKPPGDRVDFPDNNRLNEATIYYKVDDNTNLQTLQFQMCNSFSYANVGRFNGKKLSNGKFQIDSLEVKLYQFDGRDSVNDNIIKLSKIHFIEEKDSSDYSIASFVLEITDGDNSNSTDADYIYGSKFNTNKKEKPVIINKNANINFYVKDNTKKGIITLMECKKEATRDGLDWGEYECGGIAITSD